jgi:hypothetical protein
LTLASWFLYWVRARLWQQAELAINRASTAFSTTPLELSWRQLSRWQWFERDPF